MTFIIHFKDKPRISYNNRYGENMEQEVDAAWYSCLFRRLI